MSLLSVTKPIYSIKWPDLRSQWDSRTCQNKPPDPPIWGWKRMECCVGTQLWAVTTSWSSYVTAIYSQYVMNHIIGWKYLTRSGVSKPPSWLFVTAAAINFEIPLSAFVTVLGTLQRRFRNRNMGKRMNVGISCVWQKDIPMNSRSCTPVGLKIIL